MSAEARGVDPLTPSAASVPVSAAATGAARRSISFWAAALVVLALDLWTKHWVFAEHFHLDLAHYQTVREFLDRGPRLREPVAANVFGDHVRFVALLNPGMMWGAFDQYPRVLMVVRPLAVLVIFLLLSSLPAGQWSSRLALGGILGGALGNIYDSFRFPGVRDFLEVDFEHVPLCHPFPAFNLADSAICVGVAVLALGMMRKKGG